MTEATPIKFETDDSITDFSHPWSEDVLDRKKVADDFTKILTSIEQPLVIGLNATFGMGKTFFVKRWKQDLENQGYTALYFNVWDNDFSDDPLISFVVDLREQLKAIGLAPASSALKGLGETVGQIVLETAKTLASPLADADKLHGKDKKKELQKNYGHFAETKINAHMSAREGIQKFKKHLAKISEALFKKKGEKAKPIYIFIDELDRCRPTFAIEFLEQIKHIFSVPGYVFVLSTDRNQLKHSISSIYGQGMDGEGYLRRFIDIDLSLPPPSTPKFMDYLYKYHDLDKLFPPTGNVYACGHILNEALAEYGNFFGVSLREQKQIYSEINLSVRLISKEKEIIFPHLMGFLATLRIKHRNIYDRIGTTLTNADKILELVEKETNNNGYHAKKAELKNDTLHAFLIAALSLDSQRIKAETEILFAKRNKLPATGSSQIERRALDEKCELYQKTTGIADNMDRVYHMYYSKKLPITYVKEKLDMGTKYSTT